MIGQTLAGRYRIISYLEEGAFGQTYLAEDLHLPARDRCVVKQLKPKATDEFTLRAARYLFAREAKVLNHLGKHPGIPRLLAHFEEKKQFYLVEQFIDGRDLSEEIKAGKQLSEQQVITLLREILEILTFVHEQNIIHRDLKPSNIMRRKQDGKLFLIDFGAVKEISTQIVNPQGVTLLTVAIGTLGYMPSEQIQRKPKLASDIYALGMIAIFALTGVPPRKLPDDPQTGEIRWRDRASVSNKLANIVDKMVRFYFSQRYSSAKEALEAVKALQDPSDRSVLETVNALQKPSKLSYLKVNPAISAIALSLVLGIGGLLYLQQTLNEDPEARPKLTPILVYENSDYGIKMEYPSDWELTKVEDVLGTIAKFAPPESKVNIIPHEVTISVENLTPSMSLDEYTTSAVGEIIQFLPEARIIDSRRVKLGNREAHQIIYTGKDKKHNLVIKYMQIWFLEGDRSAPRQREDSVYLVTYQAEADKYDRFLEPVEETMIKSFEVE
ncbi:MAG: protein kinase [Xenococcaceae cyanobacterium MO_188.B32]|nr:protein kinase [Xenococcaceae cyanobacterium MO_188.B32]